MRNSFVNTTVLDELRHLLRLGGLMKTLEELELVH